MRLKKHAVNIITPKIRLRYDVRPVASRIPYRILNCVAGPLLSVQLFKTRGLWCSDVPLKWKQLVRALFPGCACQTLGFSAMRCELQRNVGRLIFLDRLSKIFEFTLRNETLVQILQLTSRNWDLHRNICLVKPNAV